MEPHSLSSKTISARGRRRPSAAPERTLGTEPTLALEGCLHDLFERQVDLTPGADALVAGDCTYSYAELDAKANQLARLLQFHEIGPGKFVALYFDRSELPIFAILACLKAGAAYIPIDPVHPADRIRHMLEESQAALLLTEKSLEEKAATLFGGERLALDTLGDDWHKQPPWRLRPDEVGVAPSDLCYVLYTSGTTGRPKGVMAEHRNAYRYTLAFNEALRTGPEDRVYQGFSLGFDGSVEELWMAFSNGSALVVGTKDTPRFGDDLARFLAAKGITYFSTVPTLLTTMSENIPSLRKLVVSGEACPPEVVERWAQGACRLFNVYGPTEATVNTTLAECRPGKPVTIGRPLVGYDAFILDENGASVAPGEKGELFVGGPTLARGYLNRPDLTNDKFVHRILAGERSPRRLYRTGDLVRWNADGELEFFGRIDGQIKIRGYRVELSEIESVLREHPAVRSAVVRMFQRDGIAQLGAFVVAESAAGVPSDEIVELLRRRLPDYMVPAYLDVIDALPMLASGKVDRNQLPEPMTPLRGQGTTVVAPRSALEEKILDAWKSVLAIPEISVEADFFRDLGGHSLLAAQVVTRLRDREGLVAAIRDAYKFPTIRQFATEMELRSASHPATLTTRFRRASRDVFAELSKKTYALCGTAQAGAIYLLAALGAAPFAAAAVALWRAALGELTWLQAIAFGLGLTLVLWPVLLGTSIAAKWLLVGRYRAGEYPLWGSMYFRWWLASRFQAMGAPGLLAGTPLMSLYYRAMGAKVGRNCHLDSVAVSAWDLVSIGDGTSIGADTQLLASRVEDGYLRLGTISLGRNVFIGLHSALGLDVSMGDDARLDDQSLLADETQVPAGEGRRGSPAAPADVPVPTPSPAPTRLRKASMAAAQIAAGYALFVAMLPPALAFLALTVWTYAQAGWGAAVAVQALLVPVGVVVYCVYLALLKRAVLPSVQPGTYSLYSLLYLRKWIADGIVRSSRALLLPVYTTMFLPAWLRLMGAKIGARAELSTVWYFSPEMLVVEPESFFADGCILGGRRTHGGSFRLERNHVGRRSFVGNGALLPVGAGLGDGCLLGVLSAPPIERQVKGGGEFRTEGGTEWLGSPAFTLPNRPKATCFDEASTYRPTRKLYWQRAVVDTLRILIPGYVGSIALFAMGLGTIAIYRWLGAAATAVLTPILALLVGVFTAASVVALKWAVMGRFKPVTVPLWSPYVWLNEMVNGAYESLMAPVMSVYLGTPFLAPFLRALGIQVGRRSYIATTLFSEFDLVRIGDYAALNAGAVVQNHLFEDRVMKSSHLTIGDDCAVGNMAVVLYDTEMQQGANLAPLSLLMKGERLSPFTRWHGIPTVPVERLSV